MVKNNFYVAMTFVTLIASTGCKSFMLGYTMTSSYRQYLMVDEGLNSIGYKRLKYNSAHYRGLRPFLDEKGLPDYIYENYTDDNYHIINLYYIKQDTAYEFTSENMNPMTFYRKDSRAITKHEKYGIGYE